MIPFKEIVFVRLYGSVRPLSAVLTHITDLEPRPE